MRTVIITGASSGIGQALALHHARSGARLGLIGRDRHRLDAVAAQCRGLGATVTVAEIDVRSRAEMKAWIEAFDRESPVDLVFANAGIMDGTRPNAVIEPPDAGLVVIETNVLGVLNTVQPIVPAMVQRGRGQIAIIASIASFIPLADAPSYSASKAAVFNYGLAVRAALAGKGIRVNVICPGFVTTPMILRATGDRPGEMSAERAVNLISRGLQRNRAVILFPFWFAWATRIHGHMPDRIRRWAMSHFRFTVSDRS